MHSLLKIFLDIFLSNENFAIFLLNNVDDHFCQISFIIFLFATSFQHNSWISTNHSAVQAEISLSPRNLFPWESRCCRESPSATISYAKSILAEQRQNARARLLGWIRGPFACPLERSLVNGLFSVLSECSIYFFLSYTWSNNGE